MSDINEAAREAYEGGTDPIGYAEELLTSLIFIHVSTVYMRREHDPDWFPWYGRPVSPSSLARRMLADLLNAGWTPPPSSEQLVT